MSEKPEALRLAENLVNQWWGMTASPSGLPEVSPVAVAALRVNAADELRRQHAEIERLKAERDEAAIAECEACAKENAELLQALQNLYQRCYWADAPDWHDAIAALIEKVIRARDER